MTTGLLSVFIILVGTMPAIFFAEQSTSFDFEQYGVHTVPSVFDTGDIGMSSVLTQDYSNVSSPSEDFYLSYKGTNDTEIDFNVVGSISYIDVYHKHEWFIFWWLVQMNPFPLTFNYTNSLQVDNVSTFYMRCVDGDIPEIYTQITFDTNTYDNLSHAWSNDEIWVWVGILENATESEAHYNVWTLVGDLLTFRSPDIHPLINSLIAVPIWIGVVVSVIYILDKLLPF